MEDATDAVAYLRCMSSEAPPLAEPFSGNSGSQWPLVVTHEVVNNAAPATNTVQTNVLTSQEFIRWC